MSVSASFALSVFVKLSFELDPVHKWGLVGENWTDKVVASMVGSIDFAVGIFVVGVVVGIVVCIVVVVDAFVVFVVVGIGVVVGLGAENIKWFDNL